MKICAVIPAYNESQAIGRVVNELMAKCIGMVVIDDGSSDDTARIAREAGAVVLRNEKNYGKGDALKRGFDYALSNGYDGALVMDGDGQHAVGDVGRFLSAAADEQAMLIVGNRMDDTTAMPLLRVWTNRLMSVLISLIIHQRVPDTQCGFRLLKRGLLEKMRLTSSRFEIESEILIEAGRLKKKIVSVPVKTVYADEESKINPILDTVRFLWFLCRFSFRK